MGRHFGNLGVKVNGLIYYSLSPHEQKAFGGFFTKGFPNTFKRMRDSSFFVLPPMLLGYAWYTWAENEYIRLGRKNPKDFENDV